MEEASHDPQHPTLLPPPDSSLKRTVFATIVLLFLVSLSGGAGFYVGAGQLPFYGIETNNTATTTVQTIATPASQETWKTYRNEEFGFEFQYPDNLVIRAGGSDPDKLFYINVYDPSYKASPASTGMEVRDGLTEVRFTLDAYSPVLFESIEASVKKVENSATTIINNQLNIIGYNMESPLVGPYFKAIFHNDKIIFVVETYPPFKNLAEDILKTFKFTN